jgi:very-short-patch-repair endonuclease
MLHRPQRRDDSCRSNVGEMRAGPDHMILRRLARDQWVRLHGTPRVTVLVGGDHARLVWQAWLGIAGTPGTLFDEADVDRSVRAAVARAIAVPSEPVGVVASPDKLTRWRRGRHDRLAAMVDEGWLEVVAPTRTRAAARVPRYDLDARSAAEAALFEALEATPATRGRFLLNENLSVNFGARAAEVDLLSRGDRIAIEIDGIHHFADPDCYRRDRRKDLLLQGQGLLVIRLLAEDVMRDPREAVKVVCQGLAFRLESEAPK